MKLFVFLLFFRHVISNRPDYLPHCEPELSDKQYKDTLIILVVDFAHWEQYTDPYWYFFKQIACSIPISENIRTFVLDANRISYREKKVIIDNTSVYDSKALLGELFKLYTQGGHYVGFCSSTSLEHVVDGNDYVKYHPNAHFFVPHFEHRCGSQNSGKVNRLSIKMWRKNKSGRYLTSQGEGDFDVNDKFAPKHMVKTINSLIDQVLQEEIVDQCPICDCSQGCILKWMIVGFTVLVSFVYLGVIVLWVRN